MDYSGLTFFIQHNPEYRVAKSSRRETMRGQKARDMASLTIYDILGRELQHILLQPHNTTVQTRIDYTQPGVYIYKYSINGLETQTGKLILE